jgi:hypothetical protein
LKLSNSDIRAIASLPLWKLDIYHSRMANDAFSSLTRCRGLKGFHLWGLADPSVLAVIGKNLMSLTLYEPSKEVVDGIVEYCPNLQYLELESEELDEDETATLERSFE